MKKFLSFCLMTLVAIQVAFAEGKDTPLTSDSGNLNVETGGGNNKATDETQTRDGGSNTGDKKIITSQKYVDDELAKKQNKIGTQSGTYAVTYTNTAGTVSPRQVKTSLGTNTSDSALPTVSAVNAGLDLKQTKVPKRNENIIVTYTGTEGSIGEKYIYQSDGMYENQRSDVIEAGAFNAAVKTGLDSEFLCAGNSSSGDCWLWSIHNEGDPELPVEYTRLEYLTFDGASYINTGIVLTNPSNIENVIEMQATGATNTFQTWTGFMPSATTPRYGIHFYSGKWMIGVNTTVNSTAAADTAKHTVKFVTTNNAQTLYDTNGTSLATSSFSADFSSNTLALYVGARNQGTSAGNYVTGNIGPTYLKQNGVMLYDYIPARRNSDGVIGMYDKVSGELKTKSGSGTVSAGPVVTDNVPFTTLVPGGYTPIEYIQTSGTQWIDTGIVGKNGVSVDAVFMLNTTDNGSLFGNRMTGNTRFWPAMWFTSSGVLRWNSAIATDTMVGTVQANKLYKTKFVSSSSGWTFDVNGERVSSGTTTVANTNNMYLFGTNNNNSTTLQYPFKGKMYSAQVYQGGTLVRDYIPAKQGTVVGVYDKVSDTFFTNQGSGTFTAGPDISNIVYIPQAD